MSGGASSFRLGEKTPARRSGMLTDTAYLKLREMIFSGRLHPNDRLVESDLAEQLNVSRTPVREALLALGADSLGQPGRQCERRQSPR